MDGFMGLGRKHSIAFYMFQIFVPVDGGGGAGAGAGGYLY